MTNRYTLLKNNPSVTVDEDAKRVDWADESVVSRHTSLPAAERRHHAAWLEGQTLRIYDELTNGYIA